ncbi:protein DETOXIFICATION 56-like [Telopea speciosissima]|uniref:protein DETOXIFICATION 56-like n=1 Tax=Telopea speciosissima TaxID=54955 RepID=UPI001CC6A879|nr:protein DETOXIFICATION 56-like [Telopea speciosissima]
MSVTSKLPEDPTPQVSSTPTSTFTPKWPANIKQLVSLELRTQGRIVVPLMAMNLTWFAKLAITTAFLGRLGDLQLAGGALGFTFANVTGFSVLNGLCGAMEPICGQAYGAKNYKLLHKTLIMATFLLLLTTIPVAFLWVNVDKILIYFGQQPDISIVAQKYLVCLLPDLLVISFLCPLKAYLSSQSSTVPIMFSSAIALVLHLPMNILLLRAKGLQGVSMAVWLSDLIVVILLGFYVLIVERRKGERWGEGGWWDQSLGEWIQLLRLCGPCCLTTCLEWWCYEILVLLTGRLPDAKQAVAVLAVVLNFDYLLFSIMLSLATCASIRVSNELGANRASPAYLSSYVSLATSIVSGCIGASVMVAARGVWGSLFSHDEGILKGVKKMMLLMAVLEVVNFPLTVCGGIVRGTARPWLGMYANLGGFYLLALPLGIVLAFKIRLGLGGLLFGFLAGVTVCLFLLLIFILRIDWGKEANKAQVRAGQEVCDPISEEDNTAVGDFDSSVV